MSQSTARSRPATGVEGKPVSSSKGVRIITPIPGPKAKKIVEADTRLLMTSTKTSPVTAESASGMWITDVDGNRILDFTSGVGVVNTGLSRNIRSPVSASSD